MWNIKVCDYAYYTIISPVQNVQHYRLLNATIRIVLQLRPKICFEEKRVTLRQDLKLSVHLKL